MFFLLKYMIIILLNEMYAQITHDIETILLPASNPTGAIKIPITLKVFGRLIQLNLRRSDRIVSPAFKEWKYNAKGVTEKLFKLNVSSHCFYYHEDHISSAVINFCHEHGLEGFVFVENNTLEIQPLRNDFMPMCLIYDFRGQSNLSLGKPYVIKKSMEYFADSSLYHWDMFKLKRRHVRNAQQNLTVELAVFYDEAAYNMSMSILNNDKDKLHNMILDYVNRIQNAFSRPSLDAFFNVTLISLKYLKEQQLNLPISDGDAKELLNSFCTYVNFLNPSDDNDPRHWDIGLYLTGINLYEYIHVLQPYYRTEKNYDIKGRTYQDGACNPLLSCAIVEFRDSSEITSSLEAIYKIGNLLGLTQEQSSSDSQKYVTWSKNSNKIEKLWETKTCLRDQAKTMISKPENINNDNARDRT
ncbi:zinc metalloproteinase/disintegrin-like [Linepithema humile]|uniref:zinc metalloproteinase/disintegrin-like n=1 Tax=Linepithema humile TaxID=83485 RepID=UPI00351E62F1